ncbi:DUF547 domain-containing protein [Salegentibacter sp. JZCK2]|uniref:DUF547 domain-containing protein n=1 Tax=Salegentibacter tibetensis TaxID=2873600 RepID=UPI001CCFD626|nr:DUF547 domain-containing protein [Salegentibacter tibetensis]MBZ9730875.1 DUF547 domain-containing protein [Salegentibacter tibetensis]
MKYFVFSFLGLVLIFAGFLKFGNSGLLGMAGLNDGGLHWDEKSSELETTLDPILDHTSWDNLLKKYVADDGDVNYKGFVKEKEELEKYLSYLSENRPQESWPLEEQLAYYINLYNAGTVLLIVENYPVTSIKDIKKPWRQDFIQVGDKKVSLGTIEHSILRKMEEPRIHFAINCASFSCPRLLNEAYTAAELEKQLHKVTDDFINSDKNNISKEQVELSKIFDWYKKDFPNGDLIAFINNYSDVQIAENIDINYMDYDWRLNEQ